MIEQDARPYELRLRRVKRQAGPDRLTGCGRFLLTAFWLSQVPSPSRLPVPLAAFEIEVWEATLQHRLAPKLNEGFSQ